MFPSRLGRRTRRSQQAYSPALQILLSSYVSLESTTDFSKLTVSPGCRNSSHSRLHRHRNLCLHCETQTSQLLNYTQAVEMEVLESSLFEVGPIAEAEGSGEVYK